MSLSPPHPQPACLVDAAVDPATYSPPPAQTLHPDLVTTPTLPTCPSSSPRPPMTFPTWLLGMNTYSRIYGQPPHPWCTPQQRQPAILGWHTPRLSAPTLYITIYLIIPLRLQPHMPSVSTPYTIPTPEPPVSASEAWWAQGRPSPKPYSETRPRTPNGPSHQWDHAGHMDGLLRLYGLPRC